MSADRITKQTVLNELVLTREKGSSSYVVEYQGARIGSIVSYGKRVGMARDRVSTVYASRIYGAYRIEEEGASPRSVLAKVAASLSRQLNAARNAEDLPETDFEDGARAPRM